EAARNVGLKSGDKIVNIDGRSVERFQDASSAKIFFGAIVSVERKGKIMDIVIGENAYGLLKTGQEFFNATNFPFRIDTIIPEMPAAKAGLIKGDQILSINDSIYITSWGSFSEHIRHFPNQEITLSLLRNQDTLQKTLKLDSTSLIGISMLTYPYSLKSYNFGQALKYGWKDAMTMLTLNIKGLKKVVSGEEKAKDSVSGPIGIAQIYGGEWIWAKFWYITGLLSLILAFMNILPIPGLDGGFVLFTLIEMIIGRKLPDKFMEYALTFGWILLMLLMIFVFGNDIFKLFQ
ncbi:MAG: site-2 protease family protein, partial [Bacteroidales bacterium]|nr:site-2 protease family protein [Bacteroidales bacterium]